jgi:hypothetical protein
MTISQQIHNTSIWSYEPSEFRPPSWAVRVNRCFYASLGCTVSSALISVLALQWIRDYDMNLSGMTNPRTRALYRQFRFEGLHRWFLPQIISVLPVFLHIALIIFFVGLIIWLTHMNDMVANTMIFVTTSVIIFYIVTQVVAATAPSAPFRTPVSRSIERIWDILVDIFSHKSIRRVYETFKKRQLPREDQAIFSDNLLPSSALVWLLNCNNQHQWSIPAILDILEHLTKRENGSMFKQSLLQDRDQWTTIFDRVFLNLYQTRSIEKTYTPDVEKQLSIALEASLIVGSKALSSFAQSILQSSPFTHFYFQLSPVGLLCRFALWRSKKPFPIDSNGPPIELYRKICQSYRKCPTTLILLCLREMQSSFSEKKISREVVLNCLVSLLQTPSNKTGVANILSDDELSSLLLSLGLRTFDDAARPFPNMLENSVEEAMLMILDRYHGQRQPNVTWSNGHAYFIRTLLQQFLLKMATSPPTNQTLLQLKIFRHSSLSSLWMDLSVPSKLHLKPLLIERLWQPTQALYPIVDHSYPLWVLELCQAVMLMISFLPASLTPSDEAWDIMTTALSTLAMCTSKSPINRISSLDPSIIEAGEWLVWLTKGMKPAMDYPVIAFVISAMLSGHIQQRFGKNLHNNVDAKHLSALASIENLELKIVSHMIIGLECWTNMPSPEDLVYHSSSFKVLVKNWRGFQPVILLESDSDLIRTLCQIGGDYNGEAFEFLWVRTRQLVGVKYFVIQAISHPWLA